MNKLFTTLYGSKLYGTSTPTSDRDVKHIVLWDLDDLLLGKKLEAKVKKTNNAKNTRNSADDVDEEFIPLQTFARHFVEGQTYAIELAFAIDGHHAEQEIFDPRGKVVTSLASGRTLVAVYDRNFECTDYEVPYFVEFVHELRTKFLTSNIKAMMGYVVNQASLYSFKGERLNATRELTEIFNYIKHDLKHEGAVIAGNKQIEELTTNDIFAEYESKFTQLAFKYPKYFRIDQYDIGDGVMKACFIILEKTLPFTNSIFQTLKVLNALENKYGARAGQASETNVDWKATMHAMRIVDKGIELLKNKEITLPFTQDYAKYLLSMKHGELALDPIKEQLSSKLDQLKNLEKSTDLPTCDAAFMEEFNKWLLKWLHKFYRV
jgi:hypothetical protein